MYRIQIMDENGNDMMAGEEKTCDGFLLIRQMDGQPEEKKVQVLMRNTRAETVIGAILNTRLLRQYASLAILSQNIPGLVVKKVQKEGEETED